MPELAPETLFFANNLYSSHETKTQQNNPILVPTVFDINPRSTIMLEYCTLLFFYFACNMIENSVINSNKRFFILN